MKFEFSATVTTKLSILNRRRVKQEFTEEDIRAWCEKKELIESGADLAVWELEEYGRQMYANCVEDELNDWSSYLPEKIDNDIKDELRENAWQDNTTIEDVKGGMKVCRKTLNLLEDLMQ